MIIFSPLNAKFICLSLFFLSIGMHTSAFELKTSQDIDDFTIGCCFYGVGGGGDPKFGKQMLEDVLKAGKKIQIIEASKLENDVYMISPFLMGSAGSDTPELQKQRKLYELTNRTVSNMPASAAKLLLKKENVNLGGVIAVEVGGASTASAVATAAWLDVPTIDGDYSGGRSLPEISQMIPVINGFSFCPLFSVDAFDNEVCILKTTNSKMEERLGKLVAGASFSNLAGQAGMFIQLEHAQSNLEKGTLSRAFQLGGSLRQAREKKQNVIQSIAKVTNATLILKGIVTQNTGQTKDDYYVGEHFVDGIDEFQNHQVRIWFKNECLELWLDKNPYVTSPDLICLIDYSDGHPLINSQIKKGDKIAILAIKASPLLTSKNALLYLGPRYFGFDFDYASTWAK